MGRTQVAILCWLACLAVSAQKEVTLHEVQVAAKRRLVDTGIEKTVLDTTILHENIAHSMSEILTQHTALFVKSYGRATESTAEFRGTSPSHTQVTWNGMRINSPMLGTVDFSTIPSYFVDKATLYHGASSLTLTGGGLGGAVELTNEPTYNEGWGGQYIQGVGSFHTFDQFLRLNYSNEHWSSHTRLAYSTSKNDFKYTNYDKKVDERDEQGYIINSYHPTEKNKSGYFHDFHAMQDVQYDTHHGDKLGLSVWGTHSLRGLPFLSVDYKDDSEFTNEQKQNAVRTVAHWDHMRNRWKLNVKGGYSYQDIAYDYSTTRGETSTNITHSQSYTHQGFVQAAFDYMPSDKWLVSANGNLYYTHVRSYDHSPFHIGENFNTGRTESAVSATAKWRPIQPLSLSVVLREEMYKKDFVPVIPAFFVDYILYKPWNVVLKASVARNYRYPTMDDLYFQPGGNPDLKPEKGFTYDGGVEFAIKHNRYRLSGNVSAFDSYITDWILWTPNTKGYWQPSNVKKVHNYGVEATLQSEVKMGKDWMLNVSGNFAYTPSINKGESMNGNDASYGKQLCYVPRISCNISGKLQWRTWTLGYSWVHYGERFTTTSNEVGYITGRIMPYYMSDVSLEKIFNWSKWQLSVRGVVNNLLGTEYVTVLSRPMAGRNVEFFVEIKY